MKTNNTVVLIEDLNLEGVAGGAGEERGGGRNPPLVSVTVGPLDKPISVGLRASIAPAFLDEWA